MCVVSIFIHTVSVSLSVPPLKRWTHHCHFFFTLLLVTYFWVSFTNSMHFIQIFNLIDHFVYIPNQEFIANWTDSTQTIGRIRMKFLPFTTHNYSYWQSTYNSNRHNMITYYMLTFQMTTNTLECVDHTALITQTVFAGKEEISTVSNSVAHSEIVYLKAFSVQK